MQPKASWKILLVLSVLGISAVPVPAQSQQPAAPGAPAAGSDAKTYTEYGMSNGARGDLDTAIAAFNQAISIDPKFSPAYYNRGLAYSLQGKSDDAMSNYNQAIQLDPNYKAAYYQRGCLNGQRGDFDAAIADFNTVVKLDPKFSQAYYNRGHVQYFKGDLDGAFTQINQALSLDPNFPFSYFIRGLIRHAQGHKEEAVADFQKSAGLNFAYASYWLWITEVESGQLALARKDLANALNKTQSFRAGDWPSQIGNLLLGKITRDELMAKAKTNNPVETNGRLCEAWFYSGMYSLLALGSPDKARECFNQAMATGAKGSEEYVEAGRQLAQAKSQ